MDVKRYYSALETRIGNWVLFGGRAHLAYYSPRTWWPFPIHAALLAMEDQIYQSLALAPGSRVLDAGCGDGQVAVYLAQKGLRVHAVDVLPQQVQRAKQRIEKASSKEPSSLDGVYTIETLVHATDLPTVLGEFLRVLKPGGKVALYEHDHWEKKATEQAEAMDKVREYGATSSAGEDGGNDQRGLARILEQAGFEDVRERDITRNIRPLLRVLVVILFIPALIVLALGVDMYFINTVAVVVNFRRGWRYVAVTGKKPS